MASQNKHTVDKVDMNDNDSLSLTLLEDARDNLVQQKLVKVLFIQATEETSNTMHSSCRPMPKSSRYQIRTSTKGYVSVIKRQKTCFRSALTELRLFHLGGGMLRFSLSGDNISEKNANKLTDQTKR